MEPTRLDDTILALLFASDEPLSPNRICSVLDDIAPGDVRESLARLGERFGTEGGAMRLERIAGGYQLCTNPAYSDYVARLYRGRRKQRLSRASMETLAIIAYRQPVTRADIETVRGVACGGVITTLMERSLIRIVGKAKVLGAPFLYGTTQELLEYLGLSALEDLPSLEDLEALLEKEAASESGEDGAESGDSEAPSLPAESQIDYAEESTTTDAPTKDPSGAPEAAEEPPAATREAAGPFDFDDENQR
jgi:segregation and condensation protein B